MDSESEHNKKLSIILGRLPPSTEVAAIESLLKENSYTFKLVRKVEVKELEELLAYTYKTNGTDEEKEEFAIIYFENRADMIKVAHRIHFDIQFKIGKKKVHMILHTKLGDYNPTTSVYLGLVNVKAREQDII